MTASFEKEWRFVHIKLPSSLTLPPKKSDIYSLGLVFRDIWEDSTFADQQTQAPPSKSILVIYIICSMDSNCSRTVVMSGRLLGSSAKQSIIIFFINLSIFFGLGIIKMCLSGAICLPVVLFQFF
jgi:hypothetical protein